MTGRRDHTTGAARRRFGISVALVGADGAGKSTLSTALAEDGGLPRPVKRIYMGVNLESSSLMLPTTRALLAVKRWRGGPPDLTATRVRAVPGDLGPEHGRDLRKSVRAAARLFVWTLEEWLREGVATWYRTRGYIVLFDRHFIADYYHSDIVAVGNRRDTLSRVHGWMLRRVYRKPDLVLCLDAPAETLYRRKPEAPVEWLEQRRQQYLGLATVFEDFAVIDATRPFEAVHDEAAAAISQHWKVAAS
jgi:thymidylate kinase